MPLYTFESLDSLAQYDIRLSLFLVGLFFFPIILIFWQWYGILLWAAIALILLAVLPSGFRASITVTELETIVVRKWFFIRYRKYRAAIIEDVWFSGDWGLDDGAIGVVVKLSGRELHIGTSKNMHELSNVNYLGFLAAFGDP